MEGIKTMIFLIITFVSVSTECTSDSIEMVHEVYDSFFQYRSPYVQPFGEKNGSALTVSIDLYMGSIIELNEEGTLTVNIWCHIKWCHLAAAWNTNPKFSQVENLIVHKSLIWHPNIIIRNSADSASQLGNKVFLIKVWSNGSISWIPSQILKVSCLLNEKFYPFDTQICDINFTANQPTNKINLISSQDYIGLTEFDPSAIWDVVDTSVQNFIDPVYSYSGITFRIFLRRRYKYYVFYMIIPLLTLSSVTVLVFQFPVESGLGIYVSVSFILSFSVFRKFIMENMPKSSRFVPNLSIFLCWNLLLSAMSLCGTLYISNTLKKSQHGHYSKWLEYLMLFLQNQKSNQVKIAPIQNFKSEEKNEFQNQKHQLQVEEKPPIPENISLDKDISGTYEIPSFVTNSLPCLQEFSTTKIGDFKRNENRKKKLNQTSLSLPNLYSMLLKISPTQVLDLQQMATAMTNRNLDQKQLDNQDLEGNQSIKIDGDSNLSQSQDRDYRTISDGAITNANGDRKKLHQITEIEICTEILKTPKDSNQRFQSLKKGETFCHQQNKNKENGCFDSTEDSIIESMYISTDETVENKVSFFNMKQEKKIWRKIKSKSSSSNVCVFKGEETKPFQNGCFCNSALDDFNVNARVIQRRRSWEEIKIKEFKQNLKTNNLIEKSFSLPDVFSNFFLLTNKKSYEIIPTLQSTKFNAELIKHQNPKMLLSLKTDEYFSNIPKTVNKTPNNLEYNFQESNKFIEESHPRKSNSSTNQFPSNSSEKQDMSVSIQSRVRVCSPKFIASNPEQLDNLLNESQRNSIDYDSENLYVSLDKRNPFVLNPKYNSKWIQTSQVLNTLFFWSFLFINLVSMIIIFVFWVA